jgi:hypothetical protein
MDLRTLKQRLSLQNIYQSFQRVMMRFPVAVSFLVCMTAILSFIVFTETDPNRYLICLSAFLSGGTFISIATSLWGEEQADKRKRWTVEGISLAVCAVYCVILFLTDIIPNRDLPAFWLGNVAWMTVVLVLIPFGSFLREKDDLKAWHFILALCGAFFISAIVSWVMTGGLEGLVFGTAALFDFDPNKKLCAIIMIVCTVLLWGVLFLALVPAGERKHNNAAQMPSFLTKVVSWLMIPLLCCYIVVLYLYGLTILLNWELPKGMISWLVSAVMAGYMICYLLIYPQVLNKQSWQSKALTRWLPIAILPLLVLMTVGVVRRFMDYGVTPPRLYLLTLLLWFYAVCIIMLAVERKRFRWIFLSWAALFLLSSGHPLNYYRLCRPVLTAKIDKIIEENDLQTPFRLYELPDSLVNIDSRDLEREINYMRTHYGEDYASRWISADPYAIDGTKTRTETWTIDYYKPAGGHLCPQGYHRFNWIDRQTEYLPEKITEDSLHEGILHIPCQGSVLLFDTAAIRRAKKDSQQLLIPSQDKQIVLSVLNIYIKAYSDSTINVSYSGYLFHNKP